MGLFVANCGAMASGLLDLRCELIGGLCHLHDVRYLEGATVEPVWQIAPEGTGDITTGGPKMRERR